MNESDEWIHASTLFGIRTSYRRERDGSLSLKLEGDIQDLPLFEQVCVMKEVDLHYKWAPFVSSSIVLADLDKLDTVGWFMIGVPQFGLSRDGCFRAIGCDNITEDGTILLAGQGVHDVPDGKPQPEERFLCDDPILDKLNIPPVPKRIGSGRMTMRKFEAMIQVTSPTSATTKMVANVDPNISFLPQSLLEFVMKHMAGVLLFKLQGAAKRTLKDPINNMHAKRMRDESTFYKDWLLQKFQSVCDERGWELPEVRALNLTPAEQQKEKGRTRKSVRKAISFDPRVDDNMDYTLQTDPDRTNQENDRSTNDADTVSELSFKSTKSILTNNPVVNYLKRVEEKAEKRKENAIADERKKAAERLRPRKFSTDEETRLRELKALKTQRSDASKQVSFYSGDSPASMFGKTSSEKVTEGLRSFSFYWRVSIVALLAIVFFSLLHPKLVTHLEIKQSGLGSSFVMTLLKSFSTFLYMAVVTVGHFILCDVSLVYTFDSLELGKKAGMRIREFYSNNVRLAVAACSFGVFILSIGKATFSLVFQGLIWFIYQFYCKFSAAALSSLNDFPLPEVLRVAVTNSSNFILRTSSAGLAFFGASSYKVLYYSLLNSNPVGRFIHAALVIILSVFGYLKEAALTFGGNSIRRFEGNTVVSEWREEAFNTSKLFFTYTAVFLLTSLALFGIFARMSKIKIDPKIESKLSGSTIVPPPNLIQQMSSISIGETEDRRRAKKRNLQVAPPIPEDEVLHLPAPQSTRDALTPVSKNSSPWLRKRAQSAAY